MQGKVCVFGSFNVDIVAKVERFPRGGESLMALGSSLGPGGGRTRQRLPVKPVLRCILSPRWVKISSVI
jgi:hypothetical protein